MSPCQLNQHRAPLPPLSTGKSRLLPSPVLCLLFVLNFLDFSLMTHEPRDDSRARTGRPSRRATDDQGHDQGAPPARSTRTRLSLASPGGHSDLPHLASYSRPLSLHRSPGSTERMSTTVCRLLTERGAESWAGCVIHHATGRTHLTLLDEQGSQVWSELLKGWGKAERRVARLQDQTNGPITAPFPS